MKLALDITVFIIGAFALGFCFGTIWRDSLHKKRSRELWRLYRDGKIKFKPGKIVRKN